MKTVVIVEAAPELGLLYADWLEREGYRVVNCCGPQAPSYRCTIELAGKCGLAAQADLLIYDAWLQTGPGKLDGSELIARVHGCYPNTPLLVLASGARLAENLVGFERVYPGLHVLFPVDWDTLPAAVRQMIGPGKVAQPV